MGFAGSGDLSQAVFDSRHDEAQLSTIILGSYEREAEQIEIRFGKD